MSIGSLNELATVDLATGIATPLYASDTLSSPHGLEFVAAPEPASLAVLSLGVAGLLVLRRRA